MPADNDASGRLGRGGRLKEDGLAGTGYGSEDAIEDVGGA
jgi:hypothetical protein